MTSPMPTPWCGPPAGLTPPSTAPRLLGGASQNLADFEAVNIGGTKNVLDAAEAVDLRPRGGREHGHLLRHGRRARKGGRAGQQGAELGPLHDHQDGGLPGRHVPCREGPGRGQRASRRHLRPLPGGEQRARRDELQPGAAVRRSGPHRALPQVPCELGLRRGHRPRAASWPSTRAWPASATCSTAGRRTS